MNIITPRIMVAPNGARRTKADHPALPQTVEEIVAAAKACSDAGADALHAHVRDAEGRHVLDKGLYRELLSEMALKVPHMPVQITTEAAGIYAPPAQRAMLEIQDVRNLSAALREITADDDSTAQRAFYHEAREREIDLQHILYDPHEVTQLARFIAEGVIPEGALSMLFVLGKYAPATLGQPADIAPFLKALEDTGLKSQTRFMVCAFGQNETACLIEAAKLGGDCRVGFENNLHHPDGSLAADNAARVAELRSALNRESLRALPA